MSRRTPLPPNLTGGAFGLTTARASNVTRSRLRASDIQSPHHGVHVHAPTELTFEQRCHALLVVLPVYARLSGITAARLMRVPLPARHESGMQLHVTVPFPHSPPRRKLVVGHQSAATSGDTVIYRGIRMSSPGRLWCELAAELTLPQLVAAGDYLAQWEHPIIELDGLQAAIDQHPVRSGGAQLKRAAQLLDAHSESPMESELRVIVVTAGLPPVTANRWITTSSGHRYRGDLVFEKQKVIVEYQSAFHFGPEAFRKDMTRISRLEADGWKVIQVNSDDLSMPVELVARIRRSLAGR